MLPFQGFRFVRGAYSQGVALGCHIFSLSGWYWISKFSAFQAGI
jgi:hypothetical protein